MQIYCSRRKHPPVRLALARRALALACAFAFGACRGGATDAATAPAAAAPAQPADPPPRAPGPAADIPGVDRWLSHARDELLPFWTAPAALGAPPGNFPTFRCNDGAAYDPARPCDELRAPPPWIAGELDADYTRMKSRQAFVYGAGFHLTGDARLLAHARDGVAWLRAHAFEPGGSAITRWRRGFPEPPAPQRTAQDLAYAQLGLAFYYYLTRDPDVLGDLDRLRAHIFATYWDASRGVLRWARADGPDGAAGRVELVAQLDQINAYLLLVAPLLSGAGAAAWRGDLHRLARVIRDRFFAPEHGLFWGVLDDPAQTALGGRHTDFGHTAKALWMLYLAGDLAGDRDMVAFARAHAGPLLARAAQPSGCWASGVHADGSIAADSQWWIFAELDQLAATLAVREGAADRAGGGDRAAYAGYLGPSYRCWLERFVDREHHEVWPFVPADWTEDTFRRRRPLKVFHWKSGYHSMEHALVAAITTAGMTARPIALHYAFRPAGATARSAGPGGGPVQPYLFRGAVAAQAELALPPALGLRGVTVTFRDIR